MKNKNLMQGVEFSHWILSQHLEEDDFVIDGTVGNGHDTLFLANIVGENGHVLGFDIQEKAIERSKQRLREKGVIDRVELINDGHENILNHVKTGDKAAAILYNLGYLPGSDKEIITKSKTTIKSLKDGLKVLKKGALIVVVIYPGHEGGKKEKEAIISYSENLNRKKYNVLHYYFSNQQNRPPEVLIIKKR